ncbi:MAG: MFS transporter [Candidatus Latescibacterota bacterium]
MLLPPNLKQETPKKTLRFSRFRFQLFRWFIFFVLILTYMLVFFHRMAPGVLAGELMQAFNTTGAALGSLSAIYFLVYSLMQIPSGVLSDTLGPRATVSAGNIIAGAGSILFGLAGSFEVAFAGRLLVGLGVSVVFINILKNNAQWFSERRFAFMSGLTVFIGNLGAVFSAGPLSEAMLFFSWRSIFIGIGVLSFLLAAFGAVVIRNRPEEAGFPSVREMEGRALAVGRGEQHWIHDLWCVMRIRSLWPVFLLNFGLNGGAYALAGLWGVPFLRDVFGLSRAEAASYTTVMLLAFAIGGLFFGWLSDRIGQRKPILVAGSFLYLAVWFVFLFAPWGPGPVGYFIFFLLGFTSAGSIVTFAIAKEVTNPALSGMATSVVNTGSFLATVILQPLIGWTLDLLWDGASANGIRIYSGSNYRSAFLFAAGFALIGIIGVLRTLETLGRNIIRKCL